MIYLKTSLATMFITLTMGCHKTPPPPTPVQWEYSSFQIFEFMDKPLADLFIYDHANLVSSNHVYSGTEVLNAISPYGWELVAINKGEYNVKRPRGSFTNIVFLVNPGDLPKVELGK